MREIELEKLFVGECNARKNVGDITELTRSIEEKGVLEPIVVRPSDGRYEVIIGSRRFEASKAAGLKSIPAIIREMDDAEAIASSLIENIQRGDLEPEEEYEAYQRLWKIKPEEYGSYRKLSKATGKSHSHIQEIFDAQRLILKLREKGVKVYARRTPTIKEREEGAIPLRHTRMVTEALKTELVQKLPKEELENKRVEIVRAITPLPRYEARKILNYFKKHPEKTIEEIKEEALEKPVREEIEKELRPKIEEEIYSRPRAVEEAWLRLRYRNMCETWPFLKENADIIPMTALEPILKVMDKSGWLTNRFMIMPRIKEEVEKHRGFKGRKRRMSAKDVTRIVWEHSHGVSGGLTLDKMEKERDELERYYPWQLVEKIWKETNKHRAVLKSLVLLMYEELDAMGKLDNVVKRALEKHNPKKW